MSPSHVPVMLDEVIRYLDPKPNQLYIDCTLGAGGYTNAIVKKIGKKGKIVTIDLDIKAIENFKINNKHKNIILVHENFKNLSKIIQNLFPDQEKFVQSGRISTKAAHQIASSKEIQDSYNQFDGIVFDLGLSSDQLKDRNRGFSFLNNNSPLNMSFGSLDEEKEHKTRNIVNYWSDSDMEKIFRDYGEERFARSISRSIVKNRKIKKIETVGELVKIIGEAVPGRYRSGKMHFATRTFQALRIATNEELNNLSIVLPSIISLLKPSGRMVIISFHSLEDRIVKQFIKKESQDCLCPSDIPQCVCQHRASVKIITKKPLVPSEEEICINPRARSAKMRVAEKLSQ